MEIEKSSGFFISDPVTLGFNFPVSFLWDQGYNNLSNQKPQGIFLVKPEPTMANQIFIAALFAAINQETSTPMITLGPDSAFAQVETNLEKDILTISFFLENEKLYVITVSEVWSPDICEVAYLSDQNGLVIAKEEMEIGKVSEVVDEAISAICRLINIAQSL